MEQLSGTESFILYTERGNLFSHVAVLGIYDPTTAAGGKVRFKDILKFFEDRLHVHPVLTHRVAAVPFGLDRPYWVKDEDVDIEFHVRHLALPHPGDWRQLMIQVARLHSRPLDRSRPLWEAYVIGRLDNIPGVPPGAFAVFLKLHHAAVDGMAAMQLLKSLHSATPRARAPRKKDGGRPESDVGRQPRIGPAVVTHGLGRLVELGKFSVNTATKLSGIIGGQIRDRLVGDRPPPVATLPRTPTTRFNRPISANRVVDAVGLPFPVIRKIRDAVPGTTVNDVFLAVAGGAVRRYLASKGELPERSLVGLMPISVRSEARTGSNEVGGVPVLVRSDVEVPLERLAACRDAAREAKRQAEVVGQDLVKQIWDAFPHAVAAWFMEDLLMPRLNLTVSNVPGPEGPLYLAGAKVERLIPVSMPADYVGLNLTALSFEGVLWISVVSCRNLMPDPGFFADCLRESFAELESAADRALAAARPGTPSKRSPPVRRKPSEGKKKTSPSRKKPASAKNPASRTKSASGKAPHVARKKSPGRAKAAGSRAAGQRRHRKAGAGA